MLRRNLLELCRPALLQNGGKRAVVCPENYAGWAMVSFACRYRHDKRLGALRAEFMGETVAGGR